MISIYRLASGKNQVPHFIFEKDGTEYDYIKKDVMEVMKISPATTP